MPTLLLVKGIRFFFYSNEGDEPAHVHIIKGRAYGKIWLNPLIIAYLVGFSPAEERIIMEKIVENLEKFKADWNAYFN